MNEHLPGREWRSAKLITMDYWERLSEEFDRLDHLWDLSRLVKKSMSPQQDRMICLEIKAQINRILDRFNNTLKNK